MKPLKLLLPEYHAIEERLMSVIGLKFAIDFAANEDPVKEIDQAMLIAERKAMFSRDDVKWTGEDKVRTLSVQFENWNPSQAEALFTAIARCLGITR